MPRIPENEIDRIKATIDLGALVRSRGVELKRHGGRDLIGRCPFHEEDTASFVVSSGKGLWHCMGCGAAGNVIQFVEKFDRVSFRHAFELLAAGAGFAAPPAERLASVATVPRARRATKPTYGSKQRRLEGKSQRSQVKSLRGPVRGD
jgi:DNA primase